MGRDRDESGRFTQELSDERILRTFDEIGASDSITVLSASNIASHLGCTRQAADRRLRELAEEGKVKKIELGPRSVAWQKVENRRLRSG